VPSSPFAPSSPYAPSSPVGVTFAETNMASSKTSMPSSGAESEPVVPTSADVPTSRDSAASVSDATLSSAVPLKASAVLLVPATMAYFFLS
jgi:hypothetical protein